MRETIPLYLGVMTLFCVNIVYGKDTCEYLENSRMDAAAIVKVKQVNPDKSYNGKEQYIVVCANEGYILKNGVFETFDKYREDTLNGEFDWYFGYVPLFVRHRFPNGVLDYSETLRQSVYDGSNALVLANLRDVDVHRGKYWGFTAYDAERGETFYYDIHAKQKTYFGENMSVYELEGTYTPLSKPYFIVGNRDDETASLLTLDQLNTPQRLFGMIRTSSVMIYDDVVIFSAYINDKWGVFDSSGNTIVPAIFDEPIAIKTNRDLSKEEAVALAIKLNSSLDIANVEVDANKAKYVFDGSEVLLLQNVNQPVIVVSAISYVNKKMVKLSFKEGQYMGFRPILTPVK